MRLAGLATWGSAGRQALGNTVSVSTTVPDRRESLVMLPYVSALGGDARVFVAELDRAALLVLVLTQGWQQLWHVCQVEISTQTNIFTKASLIINAAAPTLLTVCYQSSTSFVYVSQAHLYVHHCTAALLPPLQIHRNKYNTQHR
ncbi:hypothetical protein E2C01_024042 [Portunus trituberculatus]|uniref:Uncharacterized protein n=1 Tax=Portunus trituberculatus TaxID=210409 RepID=A0A5B7ECT4_PORTR|nr:hypothetical protein [Portunus trituberculatus]